MKRKPKSNIAIANQMLKEMVAALHKLVEVRDLSYKAFGQGLDEGQAVLNKYRKWRPNERKA